MAFVRMVSHQSRLLFLWAHFLLLACLFTLTWIATADIDFNEQEFFEAARIYEACVMMLGKEGHCRLDAQVLPYSLVLLLNLLFLSFPITTFLFIGFRKTLFQFWFEYFKHCWASKSFPLQFAPHFDNQIKLATSNTTFA